VRSLNLLAFLALAPRLSSSEAPRLTEDPVLSYTLDAPGKASLGIYDSGGALVRTLLSGEARDAGTHTAVWDGLDRVGRPAPPGKYEWRLFASNGLRAEFLLRGRGRAALRHALRPADFCESGHGER